MATPVVAAPAVLVGASFIKSLKKLKFCVDLVLAVSIIGLTTEREASWTL